MGDEAFHITPTGQRRRIKTTKGVKLCVEAIDGSTSWQTLAAMKNADPLLVANYAKAKGIDMLPAFIWWVDTILKQGQRIISKVAKRQRIKTHKYGLEVPRSLQDAIRIDNSFEPPQRFWKDANCNIFIYSF